jgi:H+/Cl- antiporter ClcA
MSTEERTPVIATDANGSKDVPRTRDAPKIWMVVFLAFVAILFTIIWLNTWLQLQDILWTNDFVKQNRWAIPLLVVALSFLVGLCIKYLHAPTVISGGLSESMSGEEEVDYKVFPGTLLSSFLSLLSGASVGPEGPLGFLVRQIAAWFEEKMRMAKETRVGYSIAGLASAYNGIIGNPVFSAVFATEVAPKKNLSFIIWNLLAGAIGFLVYGLLGFQSFLGMISFPPLDQFNLVYVLYAIILGAIGAFLALFIGVWIQFFGRVMGRFKDKVVLRILIAGAIIAIVVYFVPQVMFSGEAQISEIIKNSATYGIAMLLLFALLKVILFSLSFKSGYLGGPIFPTLFTCTMLALALSLAFPSVPIVMLVLCIEAAAIALALNAPLTAILLVSVVASIGVINGYLIGLVVLATVVAMIIGVVFKGMMAKRAAKKPGGGNNAAE